MRNKNKNKFGRLLVLFFVGMLFLTVLSRCLDSIMIPKVRISAYTSGSLSYDVEGEGVIKAAETYYIDIPEAMKVDRALAVGEQVKIGQGIVFLRVSDLEEKKKQLERELKKVQLTLERERLSGKPSMKTPEQDKQAGNLALEEKKVMDAAALMQKAQEEYTQGLLELDKKREREEDFAKQQRACSGEEIERYNRGLDRNGGQDSDRQSCAQAELDYDKALAGIEEEYNSGKKALESKVQDAFLKLNDVQDEYNRLLYQAGLAAREDENTAQNDRTAAQISGKTQDILQVDIEARQEEIQKLEELILADGQVLSTVDGVITGMDTQPGVTTGEGEAVEIGSGSFLFSGTLDKQETGILEEGDELELSVPTVSRKVTGSITNISMNMEGGTADAQEKAYAVFTARMDDGDYRIGSTARFAVHKSPAFQYDCLIPIGAVREDGNGKYCLIAEKTSTVLGEENIAERIGLEILETDAKYAAVSGVLTEDDRIITGSNKAIKEGDRVRIQP